MNENEVPKAQSQEQSEENNLSTVNPTAETVSPEQTQEAPAEDTSCGCEVTSCGCPESSEKAAPESEGEEQKTEKPAEATSCGCQVSSEECAVEGSPAEDLATVADEETEAEKKTEEAEVKSFHSMNEEELIGALKEIIEKNELDKNKEAAAIKQAFYVLQNQKREKEQEEFVAAGNDIAAFSYTPDEKEDEMKTLLGEFKEKRAAWLEEREAIRKKNLEDKNRIIEEIRNISEDIDTINQQFTKFQQLQTEFKAAGEVPQGSETELWKNYQLAVEQFYDRLKMNKELRDLDFKKNYEIKSALIEKAESLTELNDPLEAFRTLQGLHDQWRETGPVARDVREEMWNRFKEASTAVNKRHQEFFTTKKETERANEVAKTELCEKVEAINLENLKSFADWDKATKEILDLQAAWKELGFASRKVNNALFARFRKACDNFFASKAEYFKKTKEESRENLAKKEALCEKAEALAEDFSRKGALEEIQQLQKDWREIGMVRRKQGDEVWKRFCAALDKFYGARKKQFSGKREEETANLNAKREIIEKLKGISEEEDRDSVIDTIRDLQAEWQEIGHVPYKEKDSVNEEFRKELDRLFSAFDIRESRQRVRKFENDIKKFAGEEGKLNREKDKLVRALEARISEAKTIENNLGFFNIKSNAGSSMLKDMEKKLQKLKEEIEEIKEKINLLDKEEA